MTMNLTKTQRQALKSILRFIDIVSTNGVIRRGVLWRIPLSEMTFEKREKIVADLVKMTRHRAVNKKEPL